MAWDLLRNRWPSEGNEAHWLQPDVQTENYPELFSPGTLKEHRWQPPYFPRASLAGCEVLSAPFKFLVWNLAHGILET